MLSIQKLFRRDPHFFELFEKSAGLCCQCAQALSEILLNPGSSSALKNLQQTRHATKLNTIEISKLAVRTFVTVLDREDLEALANSLYKIQKPIEKFAERFLISQPFLSKDQFHRQDHFIKNATDTVLAMVELLKGGIQLERMRILNEKLQRIESDADKLETELLKSLYEASSEPLRVLVTKDLYDLLENVIDRCRDAGNVMMHICHKNS